MPHTRRAFLTTAATLLLPPNLRAQNPLYPSARPDVASIDHNRILAAANQTANPETLLALSRQISAFAVAFHLTREEKYAAQAAANLRIWFASTDARLDPTPARFEGVLDNLPLAEIAQSLPFLPGGLTATETWFKTYLDWLITSRAAGLARDQKDHHGTSWLLQAAAIARLTHDETILRDLTHRFKTVTLRAQLVAGGTFPHELTTPYPYRNSLFALDLLAGSCQLLSTPFENLWDFELQDGPGLRSAIARHFPYIQNRGTWPYRADLDHFTDLPVRNPSLLFAARAYTRPEYAALWKTLTPDPTLPEIQRTFPISQPLLWISKPHTRT